MAKPVKHDPVFYEDLDIEECFVNVYRTSIGNRYGGPWSSRAAADTFKGHASKGHASYRLHIKRKVEVK